MNDFLSQEEINALLQEALGDEAEIPDTSQDTADEVLDEIEKDAIGEIGNISMGSAATALSQLLNKRVNITTPSVKIMSPKDLLATFTSPFMLIEVGFIDGLEGSNLLILKASDALIIADLMMGGDGINITGEVTDLHTSAVAEAMNQMMGSAATSMSSLFNTTVVITTPSVQSLDNPLEAKFPWVMDDPVVVVSFRMEIGNLIDSSIVQVIPARIAKEETALLMGAAAPAPEPPSPEPPPVAVASPEPVFSTPAETNSIDIDSFAGLEGVQPRNLDLILDVPLKVSVVLGKAKRPIKEVLGLTPGSIVELDKLAEEPVDILINGTPIAKGEVVVVNENFGIKITAIESPVARISNLRK
ncbi:MAG: flagellar motor switch phosphatase FliY [Clostridia bacterium]|jgi:flagellar motor switch protein FliN/FliY|nr:flagellar motor switch phosphatase FliY [Clostridia bacterium]